MPTLKDFPCLVDPDVTSWLRHYARGVVVMLQDRAMMSLMIYCPVLRQSAPTMRTLHVPISSSMMSNTILPHDTVMTCLSPCVFKIFLRTCPIWIRVPFVSNWCQFILTLKDGFDQDYRECATNGTRMFLRFKASNLSHSMGCLWHHPKLVWPAIL